MTIVYQYTKDGYYAGEVEDYGLLPNNATQIAPKLEEGFIPQWTGEKWEQVENYKGQEGYLDGRPHTIASYGPLPNGWSDTPPLPTAEESARTRMREIDSEINALEQKALRPLLAMQRGADEPYDQEKLEELATKILALRTERQQLEVSA